MIKKLIGLIFFIIGLLILIVILRQPSHNRGWEKESQILPEVSIADNLITIKNTRDFTYATSSITNYGYVDREINIQDVEKVYFVIEPFSAWKAVGHTFLTFDIKGQEPIAFSVEARREDDESYSAFKGLFNTYELWYVWGNETDLITRRGLYLDHPLHMYELELSSEGAQKLFKGLAEKTITITDNPKFYNSLFTNCTNELAHIANYVTPHKIPLHYSLFFTGYADEYLYKLGLIKNSIPFVDLEKKTYITNIVKEISSSENFSTQLREKLSAQK